jgi:hypothetical protein
MAYKTLELQGSVSVGNQQGMVSGQPTILTSINERMTATSDLAAKYTLSSDTAQTVDLGGLANINFLSVRAVGGKIRVRITSSDGTNQSIPVDPILVLRSDSVNITALDLTRLANTETEVYIVLAERA